MSLPRFNSDGDLPLGIHRATLADVLARFATGMPQRIRCGESLREIARLASETGSLDRIIIFGSFVTAKPNPNDVDVILIMRDDFKSEQCLPAARPLFDHVSAERAFGASVFWVRPGLLIHDTLEQFVQRWQRKRDNGLRGIVEVLA
jgi:hypothetical protein